MSTPFLPSVGASANTWGTLLNNWLGVAHNPDGTLMNMALTTVQTANCTALANQIVPVDTTSGSITVTLPSAPDNGTQVSVKMITQGYTSNIPNTVTIAAAGSDVFNMTGGSTSASLKLKSQGIFMEYNSGIWSIISDDLPLSQLDNRYPLFCNVKGYGAAGNNVTDDTAAIQSALNYLNANGGGTLYFPPGEYLVSAPLTFVNTPSGAWPGSYAPASGYPVLIVQGGGTAWDGRALRPGGTTTIRSVINGQGHVFHIVNAYLFAIRDLDIFNSGTYASSGSWSSGRTYYAGDVVSYSGYLYTSVASSNLGNTPTNATYWTATGLGPYASPADFCAIYNQFCINTMIERMYIAGTAGAPHPQSGIHIVNGAGLIDSVYVSANSECIWMDGGAGLAISNSYGGPNQGTGYGFIRMDHITNPLTGAVVPIWSSGTGYIAGNVVSYAGYFYTCLVNNTGVTPSNSGASTTDWQVFGGGAATLSVFNVTTFRGDWAIWANTPGATNEPTFIYINNMQVNRPYVGGLYLGSGSQLWADYLWVSMSGNPATLPAGSIGAGNPVNTTGILFDGGYNGWASVMNSVFQGPSNHGIWIKSGQGFIFTGCSFGSIGSAASNTYDDLHIATGVSNVTVTGCHFDADIYNTLAGGGNKARSAIYAESGASAINVTGCQAAASGYQTAPVMDLSATLVRSGNVNLGLPDKDTDSTWNTASTAGTYQAITTAWPYQASEAVPGVAYRIKAYGNGVQASGTAGQINLRFSGFGVTEAVCAISSTLLSASTDFGWIIEMIIIVKTAGTSGSADMFMSGTVQQYNGIPNAAFAAQNTGVTINTTASSTMTLQAEWVTNAGTMKGYDSTFERIDPSP